MERKRASLNPLDSLYVLKQNFTLEDMENITEECKVKKLDL